MFTHMLLQAMTTAFCGFLIRKSYGKATKQLSKRLKSNSEEVEEVLTSLFSIPGQQPPLLLTQEHELNLSYNYPGYLQVSNDHSIYLPALSINYPASPLLFSGTSFAYDHNCRYASNLAAPENVLIHGSENALSNLLNTPLQSGSDVFTETSWAVLQSVSRPQESRNLNAFLFQNKITQDELLQTALPKVLRVLLAEREKQIQMLAGMVSIAITRPGIYAETYQSHRGTTIHTNAETPKYDLRGANFSGGFAETVQDKQIGSAQYNYALRERQTMAEAAAEFQKLLKQQRDDSVF